MAEEEKKCESCGAKVCSTCSGNTCGCGGDDKKCTC